MKAKREDNKEQLKRHVQVHEGVKYWKDWNYKCKQCNFKSVKKVLLQAHVETEHQSIQFLCGQCDYIAECKNTLKEHKRVHVKSTDIIFYLCDQCNYKTKQ